MANYVCIYICARVCNVFCISKCVSLKSLSKFPTVFEVLKFIIFDGNLIRIFIELFVNNAEN